MALTMNLGNCVALTSVVGGMATALAGIFFTPSHDIAAADMFSDYPTTVSADSSLLNSTVSIETLLHESIYKPSIVTLDKILMSINTTITTATAKETGTHLEMQTETKNITVESSVPTIQTATPKLLHIPNSTTLNLTIESAIPTNHDSLYSTHHQTPATHTHHTEDPPFATPTITHSVRKSLHRIKPIMILGVIIISLLSLFLIICSIAQWINLQKNMLGQWCHGIDCDRIMYRELLRELHAAQQVSNQALWELEAKMYTGFSGRQTSGDEAVRARLTRLENMGRGWQGRISALEREMDSLSRGGRRASF